MPHRYREPVENRLPLQPPRMSGHPLPVSLPDRSVGVLLSVIRLTYAQADRAKRLLIRNQTQSSEMAAIGGWEARTSARALAVRSISTAYQQRRFLGMRQRPHGLAAQPFTGAEKPSPRQSRSEKPHPMAMGGVLRRLGGVPLRTALQQYI
jgi:hypothetical protein